MAKKNRKSTKRPTMVMPLVSVCTPTYNRRPFIPSMLKCFEHQTYPKERIEWIIIDDGTDKIADLVKNHPNVKYYSYEKKMTLGKKRNLMHEKATGDIIVYMDDDDYYPPTRISHAVNMLTNSKHLVAGASEIYIYFKHISQMWQFGPYGPNHATAGTFAFKKELLQITKYNDEKCLAEEKDFLKSYSIPMVQLDPKQTILVFSHTQNTFDKKKLLESGPTPVSKVSDKTVDDFVKEPLIKEWFMEKIDAELEVYDPGKPEMKPDVLKQMIGIEEERRRMAEQHGGGGGGGEFVMQVPGQEPQKISPQQISEILQKQHLDIIALNEKIKETDTLLQQERKKNSELAKMMGVWKIQMPNGETKQLTNMEAVNIMKDLQNTNIKLRNNAKKLK